MKHLRFFFILIITLVTSCSNYAQPQCTYEYALQQSAAYMAHARAQAPYTVLQATLDFNPRNEYDGVARSMGPVALHTNGNCVFRPIEGVSIGTNVIDIGRLVYCTIKDMVNASRTTAAFMDKYSGWKQEDFSRDVLQKCGISQTNYQGFTNDYQKQSYLEQLSGSPTSINRLPESVQNYLLSAYEMYQLRAYQGYIKESRFYDSHIKELYKRVTEEKDTLLRKVAAFFGFKKPVFWKCYPGYENRSFPEVVAQLYDEVKRKQESASRPSSPYSFARAYGPNLARDTQKAVPVSQPENPNLSEDNALAREKEKARELEKQKEQFIEERRQAAQQCLQESRSSIRDTINEHTSDRVAGNMTEDCVRRWHVRERAFEQSEQDNFKFEIVEYSFSQQAVDLLRDSCLHSGMFDDTDSSELQKSIAQKTTSLDGSAIQHCLQQEVMTLLDRAAAVRYAQIQNQSVKLFTDTIGGMAHIASEYNKNADVKKTMLLTDFCWKLLDISKGIAEGVFDGVKSTANIILHPLDTVINMGYGIGTIGYYGGKVLREVCGITKDYIIDEQSGLDRIDRTCANIKIVAGKLKEKMAEMTGRDIARATVGVIAETLLTKKALGTMHLFFQDALTQMAVVAQKIEQGSSIQLAFAHGAHEVAAAAEAAGALLAMDKEINLLSAATTASNQIAKAMETNLEPEQKLPPAIDEINHENILKPLGRGSTGRTEAKNLTEQIAMKEVMSNPEAGKAIKLPKGMTDPRWPQENGWKKMAQITNEIAIHYVAQFKNGIITAVDDFKFKKPPRPDII